MTGKQVDTFSSRLAKELAALNWQDRNDLLIKIGRAEQKMRSLGQERPVWKGPAPEKDLLGAEVVVQTEQGERRGRAVCFGILHAGSEYERSVVVHVPSSGTVHEALGSETRLASPEDLERIKNEVAMAERLGEVAQGLQQGPSSLPQQRPRKRGQKDPKLLEDMLSLAGRHPKVRAVEDGASNHKVVGKDPNRRIYLFKNQLRADLSGFTLDHPGVKRISDDEARDMHLGRVRGQLTFGDRTEALDAFSRALDCLGG